MVISFHSNAGRNLQLVRGPRAGESSRDRERGKVICIARESQAVFSRCRFEPEDWPDSEPPEAA